MLGNIRRVLRMVKPSKMMTSAAGQTEKRAHCTSIQLLHDCLVVNHEEQQMHVSYVWLRDHCCDSYNSVTHQRSLDTAAIDLAIRPQSASVEEDRLVITWPGGHVSSYSFKWLTENSYQEVKRKTVQPRILWNKDVYENANIASAKWDTFMKSDDELKTFLQNYLLYGIAFVDDVPATVEATEAVSQRVSLIRETTYGKMWCFTADLSRGDTAYTNMALDRHTDTSYFHEPCGIQVFHCLKHEGTGGRTLLVDGFYAAEKLRERSPENFELLTRVPIRHEYIEVSETHKNHISSVGPVLSVYPWNREVYQIRYNNYDRAAINTIPHELVQRWYAAHRQLTTELRRPENELWVKLTPGMVIFIDNWRVMHGREAFTGLRQLCGCYLTRDDVLSVARGFGLKA
ncbi:trimethyllysine dioxygenase, mitochondrial [Takifugu flavidus]|uniref:Trimethyllysine dioxygenase, mitochondrial n=1 Tax=Takifugu flavidus TaxID=433684 RepID=A0A5C6P801_9TELE|nr:trimethyllysine dioxygenase, mitochondrial [Takifugu flavidus]XP_056909656.1 trimethyllysine dioxygenase, mitochondrial [Takifugu flavidus]TWW74971.1 Trimethyllysine dioxygenase, mitochondrial [Takifugu flavidus]